MWQTSTYVNGVPKEEVRLHMTENCCSHNIFKDINRSLTSSSTTKVQIPPECNLPQKEININNNVTVEPPRRIKACILYNFILWAITTIIFSAAIAYMHMQILSMQQTAQYLEATVLDMTAKYDYLSDSVNHLNKHYESVIKQNEEIKMDRENYILKPNMTESDNDINQKVSTSDNDARGNDEGIPSARRNPPNLPSRSSDLSFVHFKGALPVADIRSEGLIGPWIPDPSVTGSFNSAKFRLLPGKNAIEIKEAGLYFIYAQVYYGDSRLSNSYAINIEHNGETQSKAYCSTSSQTSDNNIHEISCYTSIVTYLPKGVSIHLQQHQKNRRILMQDGHSFIGFVKYGSSSSSARADERKQ